MGNNNTLTLEDEKELLLRDVVHIKLEQRDAQKERMRLHDKIILLDKQREAIFERVKQINKVLGI